MTQSARELEIRGRHKADERAFKNAKSPKRRTTLFKDRAWLLDELDRVRKTQRTEGTVEVCKHYSDHACQDDSHYGASTPSLCLRKNCPLKRAGGA